MPNLQLVPVSGAAPLEINADRTMMGRDPFSGIVIKDDTVSRQQAVIERRDGVWMVVDQGSANGTWIDDAPVVEAPLLNGQILRLGAVSFSVVLSEKQPVSAGGSPGAARAGAACPGTPGAGNHSVPPQPGAPPQLPAALAASGATTTTRMTTGEAADLLGLCAGAPPDEVRRQYQRIYNDLQIRLTNAPAPSLKRMYQQNLKDLRMACDVLCPGLLQ